MPPLERCDLVHWLLLWRKTGSDGYGDAEVDDEPEELSCRWLDVNNEAKSPTTSSIAFDVTIIVATALAVGDLVWQGQEQDLSGTSTSPPATGVMQVVRDVSNVDLKGRNVRYKYGCMRYGPIPVPEDA